jgi:beta-lactam-binding protein with PASTA domain
VKGEDFKYGLALGPAKVKGGYEGASEEVFINYLSSLTLKGKRSVQSSETVKEGRIISYNTGNYSTGDSVSYVVSAGPDPSVQVRNFAGESEETFLTFLKNNGLKAGIRSVQSSMTPAGMIISNDSGTKKKGDTINYVVSSGPVIPTAHLDSLEYLRNLLTDPDGGFAEARDRADIYLRSSGFIDFEITSEFSALYHPGTILYFKVDGNYHYDAADYPVYTPIVIGISSMLMGGE